MNQSDFIDCGVNMLVKALGCATMKININTEKYRIQLKTE
jgi:hypothetical protein